MLVTQQIHLQLQVPETSAQALEVTIHIYYFIRFSFNTCPCVLIHVCKNHLEKFVKMTDFPAAS